MSKFADLTGQVFGRLTVVGRAPNRVFPSGRSLLAWICRCSCGVDLIAIGSNIISGKSKSCGCLRIDKVRKRCLKHGHSRQKKTGRETPEYRTWGSLIGRCTNVKNTRYPYYGGRGITVCDRWKTFKSFLEDMGPRPDGASIDRINNEGNYEPGNCRWGTHKDQARNKRTTKLLSVRGIEFSVAEWAERIGMNFQTLHSRLQLGWTGEEALYTPVRERAFPRTPPLN